MLRCWCQHFSLRHRRNIDACRLTTLHLHIDSFTARSGVIVPTSVSWSFELFNMFYLFSFFFSAACSAPHSAGGVVFQISSLVVLWTSLHFLIFLLTREQQLPPASVLNWCSKYSWQLEFRPDRWHAKSERTTNLLTSSPLWGQGPLPKLWWKLPCWSPTCG